MTSVAGKKRAHVVVIGNEKGGCGKSTVSMHLATSLMLQGQKVAMVDIDSRQKSVSQYILNRKQYCQKFHINLPLPTLMTIERMRKYHTSQSVEAELDSFCTAISDLEVDHDFIIIDTPAADTYLMRMSHALCDTLVTPINESFIDIDVLGKVNPETYEVMQTSQYAEIVREARANRRRVDNGVIDWVVLLNRRSLTDNQNARHLQKTLNQLAALVGFRTSLGLAERLVYREFFPNGLTALDDFSAVGTRHASQAKVSARFEVQNLMRQLRLPIDLKGKKRMEALEVWRTAKNKPVEIGSSIFS